MSFERTHFLGSRHDSLSTSHSKSMPSNLTLDAEPIVQPPAMLSRIHILIRPLLEALIWLKQAYEQLRLSWPTDGDYCTARDFRHLDLHFSTSFF